MPTDKRSSDGIEFRAIETNDLGRLTTVLQALDNQWVPRGLLARMLEEGLALRDVTTQRERAVRAEYLRGLLNSRQVVLNRTFVYNNPVVNRDFMQSGPDRDAFVRLIGDGVIVPYLFNESAPTDRPRNFSVEDKSFIGWCEVCRETPAHCLRLSWDDAENASRTRFELAQRFHAFSLAMYIMDPSVLARDLGLDADRTTEFERRLRHVAGYCVTVDGLVTREQLYKEFVVANGSAPVDGRYDGSKAFAGEIKQLLDLRYCANLPDALCRFPLTAVDSLPRTALQELDQTKRLGKAGADDIVRLARNAVFTLTQKGLTLPSLRALSIHDVAAIRRTEAWSTYANSMECLLDNPWTFDDYETGAAAVYRDYFAVARELQRHVEGRVTEKLRQLTPTIKMVLDCAGAVAEMVWTPAGKVLRTLGEVSKLLPGDVAPLIGRLVVSGSLDSAESEDLELRVDFLAKRLPDASNQWKEIVRKVEESGFQPLAHQPTSEGPTINHPVTDAPEE